ncbi:hypothetical protein BGW39_002123 [Mortierella sp. 14UC]|nr:hypothetical protein BGW39_002123 [Mortierella sp. 14UC]
MGPSTTSSASTPLTSRKHQQQQSISQLADFAAHMVCYLLYGHQPSKPNHHSHHHGAAGTPPSSIPSSPLSGQGSHNSATCLCKICSHSAEAYSPSRSTESMGNYSSWPHHLPPPPPPPTSSSSLADRPTHRRILSESDIVQPKPMFRKFCLDVLSATLLSPSVILLSLKYIQQLMINLKESNKIVNTGEGAEYRFFTGALILANKFLDDNTFTNKTWADITGMKIKDVNHLEMQFLSGIEFRLFTSSWQYSEWLAKLTQFTGTYMPSQHEVAYQQQTAAAQSPISPMDPNATVAAAEVLSGSGLTGSTTSRFQRAPASTSYHHSSQLASNPVTVPSHHQQYRNQNQQQQQPIQQQQPQAHCSSLPPSGSFTFSPSSLPFAYQQQRPIEPVHRKRSAIIAFEDIMDRSPRYEPGFLPQSTSQQLPGDTISRHKRFSSSSSVATLMGSLSTGSDSFHNRHSPIIQQQKQRYQQPQQQQQQRPLSSLPQRASCNADINRNSQDSQDGVNPTTYEIDPRLWGPLDSLSLYAITTQAAKRVVAQGKALTSSANGLHMYYPTTLA